MTRVPRSSNSRGKGPRPRPFGMSSLQDYLSPTCDPNMVVLDLHRNIYEFMAFLDKDTLAHRQYGRLRDDKLVTVVQVLAERVCADAVVLKSKQETILKVVAENENFRNKVRMKCEVRKDEADVQASMDDDIRNNINTALKKFFRDFVLFLEEITKSKAKNNFTKLEVVRSDAEEMVKKLASDHDVDYQSILDKLASLSLIPSEDSDDGKEGLDDGGDSKGDVKSTASVPPREFRNLPIFPTKSELLEEKAGALEANIVSGSYENAEHYLDVQFRLLREDFVKPLREGMRDLVENLSEFEESRRKQGSNIKVYYDVRMGSVVSDRGLVIYDLFLEDPEKVLDYKANDECKNFMTGALLVLSNDNFKTLNFATVHRFEAEDGLISVIFLSDISKDVYEHQRKPFILVEYEIFFEAYRHTLEVLKNLKISEMRFGRYIVDGATDVKPPQYIVQNDGMMQVHGKNINVLSNDRGWDLLEDLMRIKYDQKQYEAYRACVTKEFTIVQGPPGTGKTFLGLRFMKTLLDNRNVWKDNAGGPILVVCYTNHALDQFLEGILDLFEDQMETPSMVRIGGSCKSERLQPYMFHNYRNDHNDRLPKNYQPMKNGAYNAVRAAEEKFEVYNDVLRNLRAADVVDLQSILGGLLLLPEVSEVLRYYVKKMDRHWFGYNSKASHYSCKEDLEKIFPGSDFSGFDATPEDIDQSQFYLLNRRYSECTQRLQTLQNQAAKDKELERLEKYRTFTKYQRSVLKCKREKKLKLPQLSSDMSVTEESCQALRWAIYFHTISEFEALVQRKLEGVRYQTASARKSLLEILNYGDGTLLSQLTVVGMTTTGAAKYNELLKVANPKIVIVEEAAEVLEPHLVACLLPSVQQVILIGDHQQLRPGTADHELAVKYKLDVSLFERMVNNSMTCHQLNVQHRMRPEISDLVTGTIYPDLKNSDSVKERPNVRGMATDLYFFSHAEFEDNVSTPSRSNTYEAELILPFYKYLLLQGYSPSQITILCTYTQQVSLIQDRIEKEEPKGYFRFSPDPNQPFKFVDLGADPKLVTVTSVDGYQGKENDIIILSLVRSNEENRIGFLSIENRICVALSRARNGLYIFGNMKQLKGHSEVWSTIFDKLNAEGRVGNVLKLKCQSHGNCSDVTAYRDFSRVAPAGGCLELCGAKMPCNRDEHTCEMYCHAIFADHERPDTDFEYEDCENAPDYTCSALVEITLPCHHVKIVKCSETTDVEALLKKCDEMVVLNCKHKVYCHSLKKDEPCIRCTHGVIDFVFGNDLSDSESDNDDHQPFVPANVLHNLVRGCPRSPYRQCRHQRSASKTSTCDQRCGMVLFCGHVCENLCSEQICGPCVEPRCFLYVNRTPHQ